MKIKKGLFSLALAGAMTLFTMAVSSASILAAPEGSMLLDDYNRAALGIQGNGGAYNTPNSKGITIYWIQMANTTAQVENNALKLQMNAKGWFGEGGAIKDPAFKYLVIKIKGEKGGEEKNLSLNPDAKGAVNYTDLKGSDGKPVPVITTEYQNIVIDIAKSGFKLPEGFEAIHFNNIDPITVYIDEIYLSKDGTASAVTDPSNNQTNNNQTGGQQTGGQQTNNNQTGSQQNNTQQPSNNQSNTGQKSEEQAAFNKADESKSYIPMMLGSITVVSVAAIGAVVYILFIRKPN